MGRQKQKTNKHTSHMSAAKTHNINLIAAIALFQAMGFKTADKWDAERATEKFAKLGSMLDAKGKFDPDELDPNDITDKKQRALFDELHEHLKDGITIVVDAPEAPAKKKVTEEEEEAPAPKKKKITEEEDETPPAKKKPAADADDEKPAKKKVAKGGAEKDEHGFRVGTALNKLAEALGKKAQTQAELTKAAGLKGTYYEALAKLVKAKVAVLVEDKEGGKTWKSA